MHKRNAMRFAVTMLAPAGVERAKEAVIPAIMQIMECMIAQRITLKKLRKMRIADSAGKTIRLEIIMAPIRRIPMTIERAVRTAMSAL